MPGRPASGTRAWIVAWDLGHAVKHAYLNGGDPGVLRWRQHQLWFGKHYAGELPTQRSTGSDLDGHAGPDRHPHRIPAPEPFFRGVREEHGLPSMYMSEPATNARSCFAPMKGAALNTAKQVAYCEMLLTGITLGRRSIGQRDPGWIDLADSAAGLRVFLACWLLRRRAGGWRTIGICNMTGTKRMAVAASPMRLGLTDSGDKASVGPAVRHRLCPSANRAPATLELLHDSYQAAMERNLPLTTHCAPKRRTSSRHEMVKRHGMTPVQWAKQIGLLGPAHHRLATPSSSALNISWLH